MSLIWALFSDAVLRSEDSKSGFHNFMGRMIETSFINTTLHDIDSGLIFVASKAEVPTGWFIMTSPFTIMDGWDASVIILASLPLIRAFFSKTVVRVRDLFNCNLVKAIVVDHTLPESTCRRISLLGNAVSPACLVVVALVFTILKSSEASWIL